MSLNEDLSIQLTPRVTTPPNHHHHHHYHHHHDWVGKLLALKLTRYSIYKQLSQYVAIYSRGLIWTYYVTHAQLNKYNKNVPDICMKCTEFGGTIFHCRWKCMEINMRSGSDKESN